MTSSRAKLFIVGVWVISFIICFPPLIGWSSKDSSGYKDIGDCKPKCMLSTNPGYVIYSAVGSFFAPMFVMIFFNWRIYKTARKTTKAIRKGFTQVKSGGEYIGGMGIHRGKSKFVEPSSPDRNYVEFRLKQLQPSNGSNRHQSQQEESRFQQNGRRRGCVEERSASCGYDHTNRSASMPVGTGRGFSRHTSMDAEAEEDEYYSPVQPTTKVRGCGRRSCGHACRTFSDQGTQTIDLCVQKTSRNNRKPKRLTGCWPSSCGCSEGSCCRGRCGRCCCYSISCWKSGGGGNNKNVYSIAEKITIGCSPDNSFRGSDLAEIPTRRSFSKRNIKSQVRKFKMETKAAKTIGIIVGCFVVCWLPFFLIYTSRLLCDDCIPELLFSIFFWLGYCNSAINPFIYALFARDFRNAFKRIICKLFCKTK